MPLCKARAVYSGRIAGGRLHCRGSGPMRSLPVWARDFSQFRKGTWDENCKLRVFTSHLATSTGEYQRRWQVLHLATLLFLVHCPWR